MASVKVYKLDGSEGASVRLNDAVFDVALNKGLVHQVVTALRNNARQGTHETKTRKDVRGGGAKPYRQKGTGRARHGSTREPQMKGGGTVWGPHMRSYRQDVPLKMRRKALCCVLSDRTRNEALCVLDKVEMDTPKAATMKNLFDKLSTDGRKALLVTAQHNPVALKSANNVDRLTIRTAIDVNALDVLSARQIIVEQEALRVLEERLS